ncbi:MAG: hypothetical protein JWP15_2513 [Alphaproteobacteria bacterium]|nr:hypothetical protein [Alphaproteobacteria bacterium]
MARTIIRASAGTIAGTPLDIPQWQHFYAEELPESRGWPVLVLGGRPYWGAKLYPMTLYLAAAGLLRSLGRRR